MSTPPLNADTLAAIAGAAGLLRAGGVVAYPSETVWGLAAHPEHPAAARRLYALKGRAADKPVQVSCLDAAHALALAQPSPELDALAGLWPGPLTAVCPARPELDELMAPGGHVGLRVPAHPVAMALLAACGGHLLTTSCNPSGQPAARTRAEALAMGLAEIVLPDGGVQSAGLASTVVRLPGGELLRAGAVDAETIRARLGRG